MKTQFQVNVTDEQIQYAQSLVDYSLSHHTVTNVWDSNLEKKAQTSNLRLTGTISEILFADAYELARPTAPKERLTVRITAKILSCLMKHQPDVLM